MKYSTENNKKIGLGIIGLLALAIWSFANSTPSENNVSASDDYKLVFSDEFNLPDGSQPDSTKWRRAKRYWSVWDRWISDSEDVVYIKNGKLVCRAIPNRSEPNDTAKMLTGAIETAGKFSFLYGKMEVKLRTNNKSGNFPAVWMKPEDRNINRLYGEIDIFESCGSLGEAQHAVHNHLTVKLNKKGPKNIFRTKISLDRWHVYGLEWSPEKLVFTIDGKTTAVYEKSKDNQMLADGQWTFNRPFFLILNQSVGDGSTRGMETDTDDIYETEFDWVRVYSRR